MEQVAAVDPHGHARGALSLRARMGYAHCGQVLVDFWPRQQVLSEFCEEITKDASCWLAIESNNVVGFTLGYPIALAALEAKLRIPITVPFLGMFGSESRIAYQDEIGVVEAFRGRKIAKALLVQRHEDFLRLGLTVGVVRTRKSPEPSVTYLWYTEKLGYQVIAEYKDGRVVLSRKLEGLREFLH